MATQPHKPPSMDEFDYFDDAAEPAGWDVDGAGVAPGATLDAQLAHFHQRRRRYGRSLLLMTATVAVLAWLFWGERDAIAYAFATEPTPRQLGDAVNLTPAQVPHNAYVELTGVTEHRGVQQKRMRGVNLSRDQYWYYRLLGSRGIFIEVNATLRPVESAEQVVVRGRAIDPAQASGYAELLRYYYDAYVAPERSTARIIQVDYLPGEGRGVFVVVFAFATLLLGFNAWTLWRLLRLRAPHLTRS